MTRDEALLKLLAVEPATRDQLLVETGWPHRETEAALMRLVEQGLVSHWNGNFRRWYAPAGCPIAQQLRTAWESS